MSSRVLMTAIAGIVGLVACDGPPAAPEIPKPSFDACGPYALTCGGGGGGSGGGDTSDASVAIGGSGVIGSADAYTYTAYTQGFDNPTFSWSDRFCFPATTGCNDWHTREETGNTITQQLAPNCTESNASYELKVIVADSDSDQATAQKYVKLCPGY